MLETGDGGIVRLRFTILLLMGLLSPLCLGQTDDDVSMFPPNPTDPPNVLPAGCSASLIAQFTTLEGSESYLLIRRMISSFKLGHIATQQLHDALASNESDNTMFSQVLRITTGLTDTQNTYLCASFLLGGQPAKDERYWIIKATLISVFNHMALQTWSLKYQMQKIAEDAESSKGISQVKAAEALSSVLQNRKEAGTDLTNATTLTALLTVYTGDPHASTTETVNLSCSERQILLAELLPLTKDGAVDEFTRNAGLLLTFLQEHKCRS